MGKLKLIIFSNQDLRQKCKPVTVFHKKLHQLIDSMAETLKSIENGAALAAPQVGVLKQITVIDYQGEYIEMVNPEIIESSGSQTDFEGCLSYAGYSGRVTRADRVKVKYKNRYGEDMEIERTGHLARCFQHEIDHLNGVLYIDRMTESYLVNDKTKSRSNLRDVVNLSNGKPMTNSLFGLFKK